ncbi:MAG TPA: hypothetical protein VGR06_04770 [Actinophytocola sp.]|jgi:hypothetical protein|uniref:hypothetical protein n=1 Tax=Actinophytocola sp. TaxID=1872138 RepID=UPI002E03EF1F|nr:hypothetical protein [Actinophytocola sp.]
MATDVIARGEVVTGTHRRGFVATVGQLASREATLVVLAGLAISVAFHWPIFRHPRSMIVSDLGDPLLQAWELAWHRHFLTAGGDFWTANIFHPAVDSFAFTDSLLGYFPLSVLGDGMYSAVMRYNAAYLIAFALAFAGAYALARQLGAKWPGAALAGIVFAWTPWRMTQISHLNILSTGGVALALFALARGHGYSFRYGLRPELTRPGWALAGWLIAAWQVTIGFAVGIPFVYLMALVGLVIVVVNVVRRRELGTRLTLANGVGIPVFAGVTYLMALPYLRVVDHYHVSRPWDEVAWNSPPLQGLVTAPDQTWLWRDTLLNSMEKIPGFGEKTLLPGFVVVLFALAGLIVSAWPLRVRIGLLVATVVATVLALGATVFGGTYTYRPLWEHLPGWDAMRTPGRLIVWAVLFLALLAAGAVTGLGQAWAERKQDNAAKPWKQRLVALALLLPALGALIEGSPDQSYVTPSGIPPALRPVLAQAREPILILPVTPFGEYTYMLWSTEDFPTLANGSSGFFPPEYAAVVEAAKNFPDTASIEVLRKHGIRTVVALRAALEGTPYADVLHRPSAGQPITVTESAEFVTFTIT